MKLEEEDLTGVVLFTSIGGVLGVLAGWALEPHLWQSPIVFAAAAGLGGVIGLAVYLFAQRRSPQVPRAVPSQQTPIFWALVPATIMAVGYLVGVVMDLPSPSVSEVLDAGLWVSMLICALAVMRNRPYSAVFGGLALIAVSCLIVVMVGNVFAIFFAIFGAWVDWLSVRRIVRGEWSWKQT